MRICKKVLSVKKVNDYWLVITDAQPIRIWFMTENIIRIRVGFDGEFAEESYSLMMTAWKDRFDDLFKDERVYTKPKEAEMNDKGDLISLSIQTLRIEIKKEPFQISVFDEYGELLHRDIEGLSYMEDSNKRRIHNNEIFDGDFFYGFGEKTGKINKREKYMVMYPGDAMGYNPQERDSLYKHIPFYIKLNNKTKKAAGYFYHNTYECDFDMGRSHSNYWPAHSKYRADGGDIDLFFIKGPQIRDVVMRYTDLTGKSALLPKYALGYLGSSMYYPELSKDCDDTILEFIDTMKEENISIDGFQLSSGYTAQDTKDGQKRCVFTWDYARFKNPKNFFKKMKEKGIVVSPNVKPGILKVHTELEKFEGMFVKDSEKETPAVGSWWGGEGYFIDFTNKEARQRWKKLLTENVLDIGTSSVWNDNCEYDSLVDKDARCSFDGKGGTIGQLKPIMANLMCRLTVEAVNEKYENERPFIVCRAGYSGIQKYAQTWAGDNLTCWESLKYNIATILGMGLSGVANYGCDIGGFYGEAPSEELFVRWVQNGIFQPRFSIHSVNTDNTVTEPWMYSGVRDIISKTIQFRYQLTPYLYSLTLRAHETGLPITETLFSAFQDDENCYEEGIHFMFGDSLFVANVVEKGEKEKEIYLPKGSFFYDYYTREAYAGGQTIRMPVTIDSIPIFLKSGGIVPIAVNKLTNLSLCHVEELSILCADDSDGNFILYEDDGHSKEYLNGKYLKTHIKMICEEDMKTKISFSYEGDYRSNVKKMNIDLIHREKSPITVAINKTELTRYLNRTKYEQAETGWYYSMSKRSVQIKYPNLTEDYTVELSYDVFDMIGM